MKFKDLLLQQRQNRLDNDLIIDLTKFCSKNVANYFKKTRFVVKSYLYTKLNIYLESEM